MSVEDTIQRQNLKNWFAIYTKPRHEFKAAKDLEEIGIDYYLPTTTKVKQWSDRKKKVTEPLIKGYIFIHATEKERLDSLQLDEMVRCVCFNGRVAVIPDWQIENLRIMLNADSDFTITDMIKAGTKVKVVSGPFEGVIGVVNHSQKGKTISITIDLLKRSVSAVLPTDSVVVIYNE